MGFTKATKQQAKLRLAIAAVAGAGKTMTALRIAKGLAGKLGTKIAAIDTERGSMSMYADRFDFDVQELGQPTIENYIKAFDEAAAGGYGVLIIDSLSHAWQQLLEEVNLLAKQKYKGNTWSAWSEGTPRQKRLIEGILNYPGHVIATMRCKTEWVTEKDERTGKNKPVKIGLAAEFGKGSEYEFDMMMSITEDHIAHFSKDRTGMFEDKYITKPDETLGEQLYDWLNSGVEAFATVSELQQAFKDAAAIGHNREALYSTCSKAHGKSVISGEDIEPGKRQDCIDALKSLTPAEQAEG